MHIITCPEMYLLQGWAGRYRTKRNPTLLLRALRAPLRAHHQPDQAAEAAAAHQASAAQRHFYWLDFKEDRHINGSIREFEEGRSLGLF